MTRYIEEHRERFGVEPIGQVLEVAPSTSYAARGCDPSRRAQRDDGLKVEIARVHRENENAYGVEKMWRQLRREGQVVGRDQVARLMRVLGLEGVRRLRRPRPTTPGRR